MAAAIKVSIIEDDDWIRENLAAQISRTGGFQCSGCYRNGEEALSQIPKSIPDVILMDINLPKMSGIECVRKLKPLLPGASGYLLKRTPQAKIFEAISEVHQGNSPMNGHIARKVMQYFNQR